MSEAETITTESTPAESSAGDTAKAWGGMAPPDKPVEAPALADPDRDRKGRFVKGNQKAKGNNRTGYNLQKQAKLRAVMLEAATPERMMALALNMIAKACTGDVHAARLVLEYTLGKPSAADTQERIRRIEAAMQLGSDLDPEQIAGEGVDVRQTKLIETLYESIDAKGAEADSTIAELEAGNAGKEGA